MRWGDAFLNIVDGFARQHGKAFFPYSAQGREMENPPAGMEVDDFNGWLVPEGEADAFHARWAEDIEGLFGDETLEFVWATWRAGPNGEILVDFSPPEAYTN